MHLFVVACTVVGLGAGLIFLKKYCGGPQCRCKATLQGKTALVTGATSGIGLATAIELARRGARVVITARNPAEGERVKYDICNITGNTNIGVYALDLNSFTSIRHFCKEIIEREKRLDVLINNAGSFYLPYALTKNGFDATFQTNYLGHFLVTQLLSLLVKSTSGSRVVFLSSEAHRLCKNLDLDHLTVKPTDTSSAKAKFQAYGQAKLCLLLYAKSLAEKLRGKVGVVSVNPGSVETRIYRHFPLLTNRILALIQAPIRYIVVKTPVEGAQTVVHCALCPKISSGAYYRFSS